jgi:hypothetical protein
MIAVYSEIHEERVSKVCEQNAELLNVNMVYTVTTVF